MTINRNQLHRLNRVINFIQANFHDDLDLHCLAGKACLSKFHFSRVFDQHVGQTPLRYLNRVRLERAARQLVFTPEKAIGAIAERCGFASHQSFTRAFRAHFRQAPNEFEVIDARQDANIRIVASASISSRISIRLDRLPATKIAYIRQFGSYVRDSGGISQAGILIRDWAESKGISSSKPLIGLCPDNRRITAPEFCVYDIGISIPAEMNEDDIVSTFTIPAGHYAIAKIKCRNDELLSAWDWLCSTWRETHQLPYVQHSNYEAFPDSQDGSLDPGRGMELCLRLSV